MENRPPGSSAENTTTEAASSPHQTLTIQQNMQLRGQTFVSGDLVRGKKPKEHHMVWAFGQPAKGQKHVWEDAWRAAVDRCQHQMSPCTTGLETPNSVRIDSCATEQGTKDTAVCKTVVSEPHSSKSHPNALQHGRGQDATQAEGREHAREDISCADVDRLPNLMSPMAGLETPTSSRIDSCKSEQGRKDTAVCKTMVSEPRTSSLSKKKTGKKMQDIQKSCRSKSFPNSPRDGNEDGAKRASKKNIAGNTVIETSHVRCSDDGFSGLPLRTRGKDISSSVEDLMEHELCVMCDKDGQLQKCSSCFLAIHPSCFAPSVRFDDTGSCPVCFYNKATQALKKAQKTLSEAQKTRIEASKNLSAFLGARQLAKRQSEQSTERQQRAANSAVHLNGCGTSRRKPNQQSEAASMSRKHEGLGHQKTAVTSDAFLEEVATEKTTFDPNSENAEAHEENGNSNSSQNRCSPIANHNIEADGENSPMNPHNREISGQRGATSWRNMGHRKVRFQEKGTVVTNSYKKALGCQDQLMSSPSSRRCYAYPPEHYSNPHTPARSHIASSGRRSFASTARRTRVIWTEAEEAALKEALAKFAPKDKRQQISWIQIHEYGRGVFHQARRPDDLMRKWGYMRKNEALKIAGFRV